MDAQLQDDLRQLAMERYRTIARWRGHWTLLIFVLGILLALTLAVALFYALTYREARAEVVAGTAASIVEGAVLAWLVRRRTEAVSEEEKAFNDVKRTTAHQPAEAEAVPPPAAAAGGGTLWGAFRATNPIVQLIGWIFAWPVLIVAWLWSARWPAVAKLAVVVLLALVVLVLAAYAVQPEPFQPQPFQPQICFDYWGQPYYC